MKANTNSHVSSPGFNLTFSIPINNFTRIENSNKSVERAFDRVVRLKSHVNPGRSDMQPVSIKTLIRSRVGHCVSDVATLRDLRLFVLFPQGSLMDLRLSRTSIIFK